MTGYQGLISSTNITEERRNHSLEYHTPIDCVWTITAEKHNTLYLQFAEYSLKHPNDCHLNYIQVSCTQQSLNNVEKYMLKLKKTVKTPTRVSHSTLFFH